MATLVWDLPGERIYQAGVDKGVLYLNDGQVVAWNGLTNVEESSDTELKVFSIDGVRYLTTLLPGDFTAKLKAFTYPDEFDLVNGIARLSPGFSFHDQPPQSFNLSYRTRVGNDLEGSDHAYRIHILYNVTANPDSYAFTTDQDSGAQPIEFGWSLTGTPPRTVGVRPTVHISIDSRTTPDEIMTTITNLLYGTSTNNPRLPTIDEITEFFGYLGALIIVDYGDGTWTAIDESDIYISMLDSDTFQIDGADATMLDASTYEISSTNVAE